MALSVHVITWKVALGKGMEEMDFRPQPETLNAASQRLPEGAYTTFRTYEDGRVLPLEWHFRRLEESARLAGEPVKLDREELYAAIRRAVQSYPSPEKRIRVTLDLSVRPGTIYISVEPLETPSQEAYRQGVWAITARLQRHLPQAKLTDFIAVAEPVRAEIPPGANEAFMVSETGEILEGLSSNFFAVKGGEIYTAGERVLPGITRSLALEQAQKLNIPVHYQAVSVADISSLDEAFITSSSRSVLPVVKIDDRVIDSGHPGPVTRALMQAYTDEIRSRLVEI